MFIPSSIFLPSNVEVIPVFLQSWSLSWKLEGAKMDGGQVKPAITFLLKRHGEKAEEDFNLKITSC